MVSVDSLISRAKELPYQEIKDSPTIPFYTNWSVFDGYSVPQSKEDVSLDLEVKGGARITPISSENLEIDCLRNRIMALHCASLLFSSRIIIENDGDYRITLRGLSDKKVFGSAYLLIIVEEGVHANINIVERGSGKAALTLSYVIRVNKGSNVDLSVVSLSSNESPMYVFREINLHDKSSLKAGVLVEKGLMHREDVVVKLVGASSEADLRVGAIAEGNSHIDLLVRGQIKSSSNRFNFYSKGIARDKAFLSIRAVGEASKQSSEGRINVDSIFYIFGEHAVATGSPVLSIQTNNIKEARHAVSISSITDDALFYLESRGLQLNDIYNLLKLELREFVK